MQHIVHHLVPAGVAGFVLANGSMSSNQSGEGSGNPFKAICTARHTAPEELS